MAATMEQAVNEDFIAHSYLKGMIERERVSSQEQKKHYETSKYFFSQAEDEFQSWTAKGHKSKRNDSSELVEPARLPESKPSFVSRESPTFSEEEGRSCNNSVISRNSVNSGLVQSLDNVEDHKIMRKIREQLMQRKAGNRMRVSDCTIRPCVSSCSRQMQPPAARDVGLNRRSMSVQEMSPEDVLFGVWSSKDDELAIALCCTHAFEGNEEKLLTA
jgi:coproporphyrinogen III oxidase-like Fe-S oxidoreductase